MRKQEDLSMKFRPHLLVTGFACALTLCIVAGTSALASAAPLSVARHTVSTPSISYTLATYNDSEDPSFNQLLGINDQQVIAGYFGSGTATSPNKGYTLTPPYSQGDYRNENKGVQTQVVGLNDSTTTVGFFINRTGDNIGFVHTPSGFTSVSDPNTPKGTAASPSVNQLLGVNNNGVAVGFYNDSAGNSVPYEYDIATKEFTTLSIPNAVSAFAGGINDQNDVVGTLTLSNGDTEGWEIVNGTFDTLHITKYLYSDMVSATGVNDLLQIVGSFVTSSGATEGFVDNDGTPQVITDPNANGFTVVNGINNGGTLVGFYDPVAGDNCTNTCDGFAAVPAPYAP
jgi:hypothetical protein